MDKGTKCMLEIEKIMKKYSVDSYAILIDFAGEGSSIVSSGDEMAVIGLCESLKSMRLVDVLRRADECSKQPAPAEKDV